eukprot:11090015-Lingulodinium_polyedra.AAC.1
MATIGIVVGTVDAADLGACIVDIAAPVGNDDNDDGDNGSDGDGDGDYGSYSGYCGDHAHWTDIPTG